MKAATSPFASKYTSGFCPVCKRRILKGQAIVRLEKPVQWIAQRRLVPRGGGRFFIDPQTSKYAHAECLEESALDSLDGDVL